MIGQGYVLIKFSYISTERDGPIFLNGGFFYAIIQDIKNNSLHVSLSSCAVVSAAMHRRIEVLALQYSIFLFFNNLKQYMCKNK